MKNILPINSTDILKLQTETLTITSKALKVLEILNAKALKTLKVLEILNA